MTKSKREAATKQQMPIKGEIEILPEVIMDLLAREREGVKKYKTVLQTNNGRNSLMDAYQEALDLVMYLKQALLEKRVTNGKE